MHGFIPQLGFWIGREEETPVDYPEIMTCIAPRPLMIIAPTLDRHIDVESTRDAVQTAGNVYKTLGYPQNIRLETPVEIGRITGDMQTGIVDFFVSNL